MIDCCQFLISQHHETRRLLELLQTQLSTEPFHHATVQKAYDNLVYDLHQHFMLEEQGLFTTINQYRSMMLMEVEHDDLLERQKNFGNALSALQHSDAATPETWQHFEAFQTRLLAHMIEEEDGIFPLVPKWLDLEEQQKVLRRFSEIQQQLASHNPTLARANPSFSIINTTLFQDMTKPISYQTLYNREKSIIQQWSFRAGQKLAPHWAGQNQCLILITGSMRFTCEHETQILVAGQMLQVDSQLTFTLEALEDSQMVALKIWPHPHYTKSISHLEQNSHPKKSST